MQVTWELLRLFIPGRTDDQDDTPTWGWTTHRGKAMPIIIHGDPAYPGKEINSKQ